MRRLDQARTRADGLTDFLRLRRESRGLDHLRAHLGSAAGPEEALQLLRRLRGLGRRPSASNGESEAP
jgi:hypothetical protein